MAQGRRIVLAQAAAGLASLAMPFLLARFMAVADYAAFVTVFAAASLLAVAAGLGMDRVMYRHLPALAQSVRPASAWSVIGRAALLRTGLLVVLLLLLAGMRPWLPAGWRDGLAASGGWIAVLAFALGASELAGAALQSALRPLRLARASAAVALARLVVIGTLVALSGHVPLDAALMLLVAGEAFLALACLHGLRAALAAPRPGARPRDAPATGELLRAGLANHGAYLLGILWAGSTLRLVVAASAPVAVTAAYGFFQLLAERGRLYLPVAFMQRQVEPQWAADFDRRRDVRRFRAAAGALGKLQFHLLVGVGVLMVAAGPWLLHVIVRPEYADHAALVLLIIVQQLVGGYAVLLWMGANASRRNALLTQAMLIATVLGAPLLWLAARWGGADGVVLASLLPPFVIAAQALRDGDAALLRALVRPIGAAQLGWAVVSLLAAALFARTLAAPLAALLAVGLHGSGVALLSRRRSGRLLARNEAFVVAHYFAGRRA